MFENLSMRLRRHRHRSSRNRRAGGFKAALHNPNTSTEGRHRAKRELRLMGRGNEAHVPLSVRIKHALGIRNKHHHHHHTTTTTRTRRSRRRTVF